MANIVSLEAVTRTEFGKGASRRARAEGRIPAVLYGNETDPRHLTVKNLDFLSALRAEGTNAVFNLKFDGENQLALLKAIAQHPVTLNIEHLDLLVIKRGQQVEVSIPVTIEGIAAPGSLITTDADEILVSADVLSIPEEFVISVEGAEIGTLIHASDVTLPEDVTLIDDPDLLLVNVTEASTEEEPEATSEEEVADTTETEESE